MFVESESTPVICLSPIPDKKEAGHDCRFFESGAYENLTEKNILT